MHVIMLDKQQIFIDGMSYRLRTFIPEISVSGVYDVECLWSMLEAQQASLVLLDGDMNKSIFTGVLDLLSERYPSLPVAVIAATLNKSLLDACLQRNVRALIKRDATPEYVAHALKSAVLGLMCLPAEITVSSQGGDLHLSARQKEILQLIADGESNKQISRHLNISAGTVKAHLESIFQKLNVHNRTQAAMKYTAGD